MNEVAGNHETPLPATIILNDEANYDLWVLWVATGRRFLPSQLLDEPESVLSDMITLDSVYNAVRERVNDNKND